MIDPEFKNKPKRSDWIMPPEFEGVLDADGMAILSESEWDEVPIPFAMGLVVEISKKLEQLAEAEDRDAILEEIDKYLKEEQSRFPDSPIFDRSRMFIARQLIGHDEDETALQFALTIGNPHLAIRTMLDILEVSDGAEMGSLVRGVMEQEDPERTKSLLQAFRDQIIETAPESETLGVVQTALELGGYEADHISGWAESQNILHPDWDWDVITSTILNDEFWTGVPVPVRQYIMLHYSDMQEEIVRDKITDDVADMWFDAADALISSIQDDFPEANVLDHFRGNLSVYLVKRHPEIAVKLANTVRDPKLEVRIAITFAEAGHEHEAIEIATRLKDHRHTAELLFDMPWKDEEAPLARLTDIILSEDYDVQKRIGVLEVVIERTKEAGDFERAEYYQSLVESLRDE